MIQIISHTCSVKFNAKELSIMKTITKTTISIKIKISMAYTWVNWIHSNHLRITESAHSKIITNSNVITSARDQPLASKLTLKYQDTQIIWGLRSSTLKSSLGDVEEYDSGKSSSDSKIQMHYFGMLMQTLGVYILLRALFLWIPMISKPTNSFYFNSNLSYN